MEQKHWKRYSLPRQFWERSRWKADFIMQIRYMYVSKRQQGLPCLFRYSRVQTVNMTAPGHLNEPVQRSITKVFRNLSAADIRESVDEFEKAISQAQIIMFPGGFSAGDEPDGSAKFFATAFQNAKMKEAVMKLLNERDGLALGICNGFQALIKLGLVPYGEIVGQKEDSPTLTFNTIEQTYFQNGLYEGSFQQIALAAEGRAWRCLL